MLYLAIFSACNNHRSFLSSVGWIVERPSQKNDGIIIWVIMMKGSTIVRDASVMHGEPVIRGTRIPVELVLDHLADGYLPEEIIAEYPQLTEADIKAAAKYASKAIAKVAGVV